MTAFRMVVVAAVAIVLGAASAPALADSHVGCNQPLPPVPADPRAPNPYAYQATLSPLLFPGPAPPPAPGTPAPPPRPVHDGARGAARESLGGQFAMLWLHHGVQGWVVGLAPGPLDVPQARAALIDALARRYTPDETRYLAERLHITRQPYGEAELRATEGEVTSALRAADLGVAWEVRVGCRLSEAFRVEVRLYNPERSPEVVERATSLAAPYGDRVRLEDLPYDLPPAVPAPGLPLPPARPARPPAPEPIARYVAMANGKRCVRGSIVRVAVRPTRRREVASLTVRAGAYRRTIRPPRLAQAIRVRLRGRRSRLDVAVRLRDGRIARQTVTLARCR